MFNIVKLEWINQWYKSEREVMIMRDFVYVVFYFKMKFIFLGG